MRNTGINLRLPPELLESIDEQGRPRQDFIRAAIEFYLSHLQRGTEAEVIRRVASVALLDDQGNVIKVL